MTCKLHSVADFVHFQVNRVCQKETDLTLWEYVANQEKEEVFAKRKSQREVLLPHHPV